MSRDNMFDDSEWQPFGDYENYKNRGNYDYSNIKEAKRCFSRFSLALFVFILVANAVAFSIAIAMILIMGQENYTIFLANNPIIEILLSTLPLYLISFPILYLMVKSLPSQKREKKRLSALELFYTFLVAEAFMTVGSVIGQTLNSSIGIMLGHEVTNATAAIVERTPVWLIIILVVIVAPIIEEIIFRKLMIDKLSRFGDMTAIIVSAVAFGLFHGNFYQFFYAAFLGLLLGYLYTKSGNIKYNVAFHMLINFFGSVVVLPLMKYEEILMSETIPETGAALREYVIASIMLGSYTVLQYAMVIAGAIIFINAIKYRKINISRTAEIRIPEGRVATTILGNAGTILFLVLSLLSLGTSVLI